MVVGLLLLSYAISGVSLIPEPSFNLLGLPLRIDRPHFFPYVLVAAAIYGGVRYYYFCCLLVESPFAIRRNHLNKLVHHVQLGDGFKAVQLHSFGVYQGPVNFELGPRHPWMYKRDRKKGEWEPSKEEPGAWAVELDSNGIAKMPEEGIAFQNALKTLFPAFAGACVWSRWNYESVDPPMRVRLHVVIPKRCRLAAVIEDIDYLAPVWLSALSVLVFAWNRFAA